MERKGKVSLWLGKADSLDRLEEYLKVSFSTDGEWRGSEFTSDYQIEFFDSDFREAEVVNPSSELELLLEGFSYDDSVIPRFKELVTNEIPGGTNAVVLLYNFEYEGRIKNSSNPGVSLEFIGCVDYN